MKIFTAAQVYEADKQTIRKQGISGTELMERASLQLFAWVETHFQRTPRLIRIFCGTGNNGGDGLALARHLLAGGYQVSVYVVNYSENRSPDFLINLDRLKTAGLWPEMLSEATGLPEIETEDLVVDAIFGIGLNRPPAPWVGDLIKHINSSGAFRIAVDLPSGLYADQDTGHDRVIRADVVLTFQAPKMVFFLPGTAPFCGHWEVLDIGLDPDYLLKTEVEYEWAGPETVFPYYRRRDKFSHKGTYGHSLIIGGSYGKIGAAQLSARACLFSGSGLVTAYLPRCGYHSFQTALPEVMVLTDPGEEKITEIRLDLNPDAVGIGIGMGTSAATLKAFSDFLRKYSGPLVIDADGLNMLAAKPELLRSLPPQTILTPHPGELKRLIGPWKGDFEKLELVRKFSRDYDCIVLIKGAYTLIYYNGKGVINSTGNPGMATGGSGDVLTGVITALLAQGYPPREAAIVAAYVHGRAGDLAVHVHGYEALSAGRILDSLGAAFLELSGSVGSSGSSPGP